MTNELVKQLSTALDRGFVPNALVERAKAIIEAQANEINQHESIRLDLVGELSEQTTNSITFRLKSEEQADLIDELVGSLEEISDAPNPDMWVPQFQHVKDIANTALAKAKEETNEQE